MNSVVDLQVLTLGGVQDLCRVLGVLALLDLTPARLAARPCGGGLEIELRLEGDARSVRLCQSRLGALVAVRALSAGAAASAAERPCKSPPGTHRPSVPGRSRRRPLIADARP